MTEAGSTFGKIPTTCAFANRACAVVAIFILPIVAIKLTAQSSYCTVSMLTIFPRFSHLLEDGIVSPLGICTYEILSASIFTLRVIFTVVFGRLLFDQALHRAISGGQGGLALFPNIFWFWAAGSMILFVMLFTSFDWGSRRENIKMAFLTLSIGGAFSFLTPAILPYWLFVMRARMADGQPETTWREEEGQN